NRNINALNEFVRDPENYKDFQFHPYRMMDYVQDSLAILFDHLPSREKPPKKWDEGDVNKWILNQVMAPNPFIRYLTSMMYLSNLNGLSRINYPKSEFMKVIDFGELSRNGKPFIFHNAWDLDRKKLAFFSNRPMEPPKNGEYMGPITA